MQKSKHSNPVGKVIPLRRVIIHREKLANDMEWQGKWAKADALRAEVDRLKQQEKDGEVWYPEF